MNSLAIFIVLLAAASASPCDPVPGVTTNIFGIANNAFKTTTKLVSTNSAIALASLVQNVGQVSHELPGCLQHVLNNVAPMDTLVNQLTSLVASTTATTIYKNLGQITSSINEIITTVDQSFEIAYKNIGNPSQIIHEAITELSQTIQNFATIEYSAESAITSTIKVGYAINQLVACISQVTNQVNFNSASTGVIEGINALPVGLGQILGVLGNTFTAITKFAEGYSPQVSQALRGLVTTVLTTGEDVTGIINQINKSLTTKGGVVYGLTQNHSYLVSSLQIAATNSNSNLNTLLGNLNTNTNEVPARYLSVELGSIINEYMHTLLKLVQSGIRFGKIVSKDAPVFGNLYSEMHIISYDFLNYIANMSASNVSPHAIPILQNKILTYTNRINSITSQLVVAAQYEVTVNDDLRDIAQRMELLVADYVIDVNTFKSNVSVFPVDLNLALGNFFSTLIKKANAASDFTQFIAQYKQHNCYY